MDPSTSFRQGQPIETAGASGAEWGKVFCNSRTAGTDGRPDVAGQGDQRGQSILAEKESPPMIRLATIRDSIGSWLSSRPYVTAGRRIAGVPAWRGGLKNRCAQMKNYNRNQLRLRMQARLHYISDRTNVECGDVIPRQHIFLSLRRSVTSQALTPSLDIC